MRTLLTLLVVCLAANLSISQTSTATVEGLVTDASGAAIPGAAVTVTSTETNISHGVTSDEGGHYLVSSLHPGQYKIQVSAAGFSSTTLTGITLAVAQTLGQNIQLSLGEVEQTVSVVADNLLMNTETSDNGQLIDNKKVVEMPIANRNFYSLALLSPAAAPPAQNSTLGFRGGINVAGVSEISNLFSINGVYNNDIATAQPSYRPSLEVIREFKLLTGVYSAEYGRMMGGQVVIATKSGTNQFHGSVYEFLRNQATDAKPYFAAYNASGQSINPDFKQNTYGATVGGPVLRNKTFFFYAFEAQRIRQQITNSATVPTGTMLQGLFNNGKALVNPYTKAPLTKNGSGYYDLTQLTYNGTNLWTTPEAQVGQFLANHGYPTPSSILYPGGVQGNNGVAPSNNYDFSETRVENMTENFVRIDQTFSDKDSMVGHWGYFTDPSFEPSNTLCSAYVLPKFGCYTNQQSTTALTSWDHIFKPTLLNEVRIGFSRLVQPRLPQDTAALEGGYSGLPGAFNTLISDNQGLPNTAVAGYSTFGSPNNIPQNRWDNHWNLVDVLTWTKGAHNFKFGGDLFLVRTTNYLIQTGRGAITVNAATSGSSQYQGPTTGDSMADLLLGLPTNTTQNPTGPTNYENFRSYDLFVQDDYKIKPYLTLNLGIRWEYDEPVYSPHNTLSNFDVAQGTFVQAGPSTYKHLYNSDFKNFAPRVGFAWQPFKKQSTVVKSAFGLFYNTPLIFNEFLTPGLQYPIKNSVTYYTGSASTNQQLLLSNPFPASKIPTECTTTAAAGQPAGSCSPLLSPVYVSPDYKTPYIVEYSLGIQRSITSSMVLETTYFGSQGSKLPFSININSAPPGGAGQSARYYSSNFLTLNEYQTVAKSYYNSLQTSLTQTFHHGVTFLLAYTYGRSIDLGGGIGSGSNSSGTAQNPLNVAAEKGPSDFNIKHRIAFSPVAELPFGKNEPFLNHGFVAGLVGGWQLSGIFQFQTGRPFSVSDVSSGNSGSLQNADRPNYYAGADPNASVDPVTGRNTHTRFEWFNVSAYTLAPKGQFGNVGRNTLVGPGLVQVDAAIKRSFSIYERLGGEFRVEAFNIANHPNLGDPLGTQAQLPSSVASGAKITAGQVGTFGTITSTQNAFQREMQFAMKLTF
jgi:hypothetical protein